MRVTCVHCSKSFSLSDENAGTHFRCPKCQQLSPVAGPPTTNATIQRPKPAAVPPRRAAVKQRPPDPAGEDALLMAEVVSRSDDRLAQPAPWDLLSQTALPLSNVVLTPVPPQEPPRKEPVTQRKPRRKRRAADSDRLAQFFGGLVCAFFGLVMVVGAVLLSEYLRREHGLWWGGTRWIGRVGVATILLGIGVTLSSFRNQ